MSQPVYEVDPHATTNYPEDGDPEQFIGDEVDD